MPANTQTPLPDQPPRPTSGGGQPKARRFSALREFSSFISVLVIAGVLALLLITFVFRSYAVDGPSMLTTLHDQDKLIIWKVPRTISRITKHQYVPDRGDIIIFDQSNLAACGQSGTKQLIKRVIGLPGDHVVYADQHFTVYNTQYPGGFNPDATLPYDKDGHIPGSPASFNVDVTVASDQIFVSGDNRPDSCDSRSFGPIQTNQVIGKLVIRLLPANTIKLF